MNVAFPALLLFLVVLPGIILRYTYARGPWSWKSPTSFRSISDEIAYGVGFSIVLHSAAFAIAGCFGVAPDLEAFFILLTGASADKVQLAAAISTAIDSAALLTLYFFVLVGSAALLGLLAHFIVRRLGLDHKTRFLRFSNEWYYLLTGEVLKFSEQPFEGKDVDGVYLSAVVDHGDGSYVYRGIITDFSFDKHGELDRIVLRMVHRRRLSEDRSVDVEATGQEPSQEANRYYDIHGDLFVLRYSETRTINLDYFFLGDSPKD